MRPWKIVLSGLAAAFGVVVAMLRPGLSAAPPHSIVSLLLPRLPVLGLIVIAVYALVAILLSAAGLVAAALRLRRELGRIDALSQAAAALDWIAAFDATPLRGLVPRLAGALPRSPARGATILLASRFDRRTARTEVAHLFYIWLARSHCLAALVGLATITALGFAQRQGGVPFLPGSIPTAAAALVLLGLLLLVLLARFAIDVTVDPLIEAMTRLPWEPLDVERVRHAGDLLEAARSDAAIGGRVVAQPPSAFPEQLALVLEDGGRGLSAASERLSAAADAIGTMVRSAVDALAPTFRDGAPVALTNGEEAQIAALQAAVEALTAQLRQNAAVERLPDTFDRDRRALVEAAERLSVSAEAIGAATRFAVDSIQAALREATVAPVQSDVHPNPAAAEIEALQVALEALAGELRQFTELVGAAGEGSVKGSAGRAAATSDLGRGLRQLLEDIGPENG